MLLSITVMLLSGNFFLKIFRQNIILEGRVPHKPLTGKVLKAGVKPAYAELIEFTTFHQNSINTGKIGLK
jgi:hypothetical protein